MDEQNKSPASQSASRLAAFSQMSEEDKLVFLADLADRASIGSVTQTPSIDHVDQQIATIGLQDASPSVRYASLEFLSRLPSLSSEIAELVRSIANGSPSALQLLAVVVSYKLRLEEIQAEAIANLIRDVFPLDPVGSAQIMFHHCLHIFDRAILLPVVPALRDFVQRSTGVQSTRLDAATFYAVASLATLSLVDHDWLLGVVVSCYRSDTATRVNSTFLATLCGTASGVHEFLEEVATTCSDPIARANAASALKR